jgi:hypothetical protein
MTDNFPFSPGSGATGGAKNVGGVLYPQVIATEIDGSDTGIAAKLGPVTETAPTTDTASSGLNGRLQRIAQRLTTLIGSTIAVSGTFWQAVQPVSGTFWQAVQPVSGTFWQTTQPVSAASLPLPTGAALETGGNLATIAGAVTSSKMATKAASGDFADGAITTIGAKTDAANTATDTTSVSGISIWKQISKSVQAIATSIAGTITATVSGTVTANAGTNLNTSALALETGGNLATIAGAVSSSKVAVKAASGDLADGALATIGTKADAKNSATDTTAVSGISIWKQISASVQAIATSVAGTLTVATHAVTQSGTWNVTVNAAIAAGTNLIGKFGIDQTTPGTTNAVSIAQLGSTTVATGNGTTSAGVLRVAIASDNTANTNPFLVNQVPATTGGPTLARIKAAASTNATNVKASAGQIYGYALFNNTSSAKFFKVYNKASSPTVGTDTPAFTIIVPANGGANVSWDMGIPLGTGIAYAITGAIADSDTTSTAADDVHGLLLYK